MSDYRIVYDDELYHHGIKGQQWDVRNGPPYPIDHKIMKKQIRNEAKRKAR